MTKTLNKIKDKLKETNTFLLNQVVYDEWGQVVAPAYANYIIVEPLTAETERQMRSKKYIHLLKSKQHFYALFYFPKAVQNKQERERNRREFSLKYQTRLDYLWKSKEMGHVRLSRGITLSPQDFLKLEYIAKPYDKSKKDFQDNEIDTLCKSLIKEQKPYQEIKRVSLNYNTLLILDNARENGNKALFRYLKSGTNTFYSDIIINYILEHSDLLSPDYYAYENASTEVHIKGKELLKLYPYESFKLSLPDGVTLTNSRPTAKRLSKNDTLIFRFSDDFLNSFRAIISKSDNSTEDTKSFMRVPAFFVLQALKDGNIGANGFQFLLWFLCFYRISKSPKIFHSVRTILTKTGADMKHGYKKTLATLNRYFNYLFSINAFYNIPAPVKFTIKDLDEQPRYNGALIQLRKPKLKPPKEETED